MAIIISTLGIESLATVEELGRITLVLIVFGFAALPMIYLFSMLFKVPSGGLNKMIAINIFTGISKIDNLKTDDKII